jgi:GDP-L-fucose synthase
MSSKVLVLGATGFVGRHVVEVLTAGGLEVHQASRKLGVDLRSSAQCQILLDKVQPEWIVNCAAHVGSLNYVTQQAAEVMLDNARMLLSMYEAVALRCPQAVVINPIANCAFPGDARTYVEDEWMSGPIHPSVLSYGATRRFLWYLGESFNMQHQVRSIYLFVPNMYGPYDSTDPNKAHALNALISKFVKAEREGQDVLEIWGTGVAIREWLYAGDYARIVLEVVLNPRIRGLGEPVSLAQNFGVSVRELVDIIQHHFHYKGRIQFDPTKDDGAPKKVMDDTRFRKIFPDFKFTLLDDGIRNAIQYYSSVYPY